MMNMTELHNLPAVEKLKIIESLWADLSGEEDGLPNLFWHEAELMETEQSYETGAIELLDWQQAKKELRSRFE